MTTKPHRIRATLSYEDRDAKREKKTWKPGLLIVYNGKRFRVTWCDVSRWPDVDLEAVAVENERWGRLG